MKLPSPFSAAFSKRLCFLVGATFLASSAHAQFIAGFTKHDFPDINSQLLIVRFDAGSDTLTVVNQPTTSAQTIRFVPEDPDDPGPGDTIAPQYNLSNASFALSATFSVNASGTPTLLTGGTISINGYLSPTAAAGSDGTNPITTPYSFGSPGSPVVLIQGNLTAFGYDNDPLPDSNPGQPGVQPTFTKTFQFLFTRTGGALDPLFPGNDSGRILLSGWGNSISASFGGGGGAFDGNFNHNFGGMSGVADTTIPEGSQFAGIAGILMVTLLARRRMSFHSKLRA